MALECLAILGTKNEPMYLRAPNKNPEDDSGAKDVFGFSESDAGSPGLSIRQEFMMHAALDRLEEILGSSKFYDILKMQRGTKWMGSLLPMEDFEIYGYVTTSNIKILALIKRDSVIPLTKRKDSNVKNLFANIHDAYVKYTMNPFTQVRGKIEKPCIGFERRMNDAIEVYNESLLESTTTT